MFIILFGITGEIGHKVRDRYLAKGFKKLHKVYYSEIPSEAERLRSEGCDMVSSADEITKKCDYSYKVNDRLVGFNQQDFIKAVNGEEDLFATFSCTDIEFLKQLRENKKDYVTIVYVYIDDTTLEKVTRYYDKSESSKRLSTGKKLKHIYNNNNQSLFDNVVLYGGEDSVFNAESLYSQIDAVIEHAKEKEIRINSKRKVALPYGGTEPYVFVSYSHRDKKDVMGKLRLLQREGYRIWYDTGLVAGQNWRKVLREKIKFSQNVIVFTSARSVRSKDVGIEIVLADAFEKKIINVTLDDATFKGTIGKIMGEIHAVSASSEHFEEEMIEALDDSARESEGDTV